MSLTKVFLRAILGQFWGNGGFFIGAKSQAPIFFSYSVGPAVRGLVKGL